MVKIRFKRAGSKFNAFYQIVATDSHSPRDGKFIESLGHYNPHTKEFVLNEEATQKWINQGAQVSQTVKNLFKTKKLNEKFQKGTLASKKEAKEKPTKKATTSVKKTAAAKKPASAKKATTAKKTTK
ncbi:30S ribosomal protein S16 [Mycoplasma sp. Mirounga ES2805-ORL]|uniref:30S ribosomal protein S16 n=1 Tax=Mycoplasma sp. Mirounga ES2805-ORL TaxID=754514 RepID=UPI00197B19D6|nr:30S ribosomal protein S16 [Mycoplasma sp. Mirounga ES2805-ORL]